MDARTIFNLIRPHLDSLRSSEREQLVKLISGRPHKKITCHHRKIFSASRAKRNLKLFSNREAEREKMTRQGGI